MSQVQGKPTPAWRIVWTRCLKCLGRKEPDGSELCRTCAENQAEREQGKSR